MYRQLKDRHCCRSLGGGGRTKIVLRHLLVVSLVISGVAYM
jgi:hypothetical protein